VRESERERERERERGIRKGKEGLVVCRQGYDGWDPVAQAHEQSYKGNVCVCEHGVSGRSAGSLLAASLILGLLLIKLLAPLLENDLVRFQGSVDPGLGLGPGFCVLLLQLCSLHCFTNCC
jgi:hypothetical protein